MKKALVFLANGFEEAEALVPVDILRRGEIELQMVSVTGERMVKGAHNIWVQADCLLEELTDEQREADVYLLPGGMPGAETLAGHKGVQELILSAAQKGKLLAAICAAPMALGVLGLLCEKEAVCYPGFEKYLTGARISEEPVVKDGNIITAKGAGVAFPFGYAILKALQGEERVSALKAQMMWQD